MLQCALLFHFPFIHSAIMFRTNILRNTKYRKEFETAEDYDLVSRIAEHSKMATLKETLALFRIHENNASSVRSVSNTAARKNVRIRQLQHIGISPSDEEIQLIFDATNIKSVKSKIPVPEEFLRQLKIWMNKLLTANENAKIYDQNSLIAYLWFRWILACCFLGRKKMIPQFGLSRLNLSAARKLTSLLLEKL